MPSIKVLPRRKPSLGEQVLTAAARLGEARRNGDKQAAEAMKKLVDHLKEAQTREQALQALRTRPAVSHLGVDRFIGDGLIGLSDVLAANSSPMARSQIRRAWDEYKAEQQAGQERQLNDKLAAR